MHNHVTPQAVETPRAVEQLIKPLKELRRPLSKIEIEQLLCKLLQQIDDLSIFQQFNDLHYSRNRVFQSEFLDVLVLCWKPNQKTPIHDHTGSTCGVAVLNGEATEVVFKPSGTGLLLPGETKSLRPGEITVSIDSDAHLVGNFRAPEENLVTLHCYSPPLAKMKIFGEQDTFFSNYASLASDAIRSGFYAGDM